MDNIFEVPTLWFFYWRGGAVAPVNIWCSRGPFSWCAYTAHTACDVPVSTNPSSYFTCRHRMLTADTAPCHIAGGLDCVTFVNWFARSGAPAPSTVLPSPHGAMNTSQALSHRVFHRKTQTLAPRPTGYHLRSEFVVDCTQIRIYRVHAARRSIHMRFYYNVRLCRVIVQ